MALAEFAKPTLSAAPLVASVSADGAGMVVTLRGEADPFTLPVVVDVLARVIADSDGMVIVDLAETEFMDVGTVRVLGRASRFLSEYQRTLTLRSPSRTAGRVLGVLGLSYLIEPDGTTATPSQPSPRRTAAIAERVTPRGN